MTTLGDNTNKAVDYKDESYSIAHKFLADAAVFKGTIVKLNATGGVTPTTAATDVPIGKVDVGTADGATSGDCTVSTKFTAIIRGTADGALAIGDVVYGSGVDAAKKQGKFKKTTTSGDIVIGVVLVAAADTATATIGIYRSPEVVA